MRILIVGSGGREHALAWKCAAAARVSEVLVAPGNAGTALEPKVRNVGIAAADIQGLITLARSERIALTIVGPEAPLVAGVVDAFEAAGLRCFGPRRGPAQLEGSKAFAKEFLRRHRIPTARHVTFTRDNFDLDYIRRHPLPVVVKASGLAAGKGVIIAPTTDAALAAVESMFAGQFGAAGREVVIEEHLSGEEASYIVMADGSSILTLATSQDHKRLRDQDSGPNTGGMGAYSPAPVVTAAVHDRILREVIHPTIQGLAAEGMPYTGFLYAGLMIAPDGTPNVIEFNCRLGDPETQPILMRLESDISALCEAALQGRLDSASAAWDARAALGVVMAAEGYPDATRQGDRIEGLDRAALLPGKVFHAGTRLQADEVLTDGGRVLCAVGLGNTISEAHIQAYRLVNSVRWRGMQYRRDIGHRAMAREQSAD